MNNQESESKPESTEHPSGKQIHLIDTSGLTANTRESIEMVWGRGKWEPASMGGHDGEIYRADDGMNVFATNNTVKEDLREAQASLASAESSDA